MQIDLKTIRRSYGLSRDDFAALIGLKKMGYIRYESKGELPSKYVYELWKQLDDFPIPDDFFYYTSFTLAVNMKYHNMTQTDIAKFIGISNQSTISGYLSQNIPMYEKKADFLKFNPFIIPLIAKKTIGGYKMEKITNLVPKGNFILVEKRQTAKEERETKEITGQLPTV